MMYHKIENHSLLDKDLAVTMCMVLFFKRCKLCTGIGWRMKIRQGTSK